MNSKAPGLYIHVPFCVRKCDYCDFYSEIGVPKIPAFLRALFKEMERYRGKFGSFDTVYLGGGTPSLLNPEQLQGILTEVREEFKLLPDSEITLEANPADLGRAYLESIRGVGINRLNIGVQSFDQRALDFLGRRHSVKQAVSAIESARGAEVANLGLDLIYGIPGQGLDAWLDTLRCALAFEPEHLSCYQLTVEPKTPLGIRHQKGELFLPQEDSQHEFFMKTSRTLEGAGYVHYEVSNFARGMKSASRHNQKYWDHTPYLGLGPSAHSFLGHQRWWNCRSVDRYIAALESGEAAVEAAETLSLEQLQLETLYLGLRTRKGIHLQDYTNRYGCDLLAEKRDLLAKLCEGGFVSLRDGCLYPTRSGLAVADSLALM